MADQGISYETFVFGEFDADNTAENKEKLITGLLNTIEFGNKASQALENLKKDGFLLEPVTTVMDLVFNSPVPSCVGTAHEVRLPPVLEPTRDFCPDLSTLNMTLVDCGTSKNGGVKFPVFKTVLAGERVVWDGTGPITREEFSIGFGRVRNPKSGPSWEKVNRYGSGAGSVIQLYESARHADSVKAMRRMAEEIADEIIISKPEMLFTNKLREKVADWLMDDKIVLRLMKSVRSQLKIASVMLS